MYGLNSFSFFVVVVVGSLFGEQLLFCLIFIYIFCSYNRHSIPLLTVHYKIITTKKDKLIFEMLTRPYIIYDIHRHFCMAETLFRNNSPLFLSSGLTYAPNLCMVPLNNRL